MTARLPGKKATRTCLSVPNTCLREVLHTVRVHDEILGLVVEREWHVHKSKKTRIPRACLIKKRGTAQPLPVEVVNAPVRVKQEIVEDRRSIFPALPQVTPRQEAGHCVPGEVVNPPGTVREDVTAGRRLP